MKSFYLLALHCLLGGAALAQGSDGATGKTERELLREQRRTEIRHALQAPYAGAESREGPYQLSLQERQALRQQLRQQNPGSGRSTP